ncbi:MAG: hypothetical protein HYR62_10645 [Actinobacteria bacterium]|nr:hypothetical protein [Actinomycetota bacterium]MBI3686765.1 hypothetical protein [Actinomycetota bacterium]
MPRGARGEGFTALGAWLSDLRARVTSDPAELPREPTLLLIEAVDRLLSPHLPRRGRCPACSARRHKVAWPCEVYQSTRRVLLGDRCVPRPGSGDRPAPWGPAGSILALRVPASADSPCRLLRLPPTAADLSDALGGALLDDVVHELGSGRRFRVYLDEGREARRLPVNRRAGALLGQPGGREPAGHALVRGDVLVTGVDGAGNDVDIPAELLPAVRDW